IELEAIANERAKLNRMERLLRATRHALEMKGAVEADDIFLFIRSLQSQPTKREAFLARHFTPEEAAVIRNLPDLSSNDERSMQWAKLIRRVKETMQEPADSPIAQELAADLIEASMAWFEGNEALIDKYWRLVMPEE